MSKRSFIDRPRCNESTRRVRFVASLIAILALQAAGAIAQPPATVPFKHRVETYFAEGDRAVAFVIRLEQPFLADEFEKSNFLRATPLTENVHLIYPRQTRFEQKHAAFYGRLRVDGNASGRVRIDYEIVSEAIDGSRTVQERHVDVDITRPAEPGGNRAVMSEWARAQAEHFRSLLRYYPSDAFLQFVLLQSRDRHGTPAVALPAPSQKYSSVETELLGIFEPTAPVDDLIQRERLTGSSKPAGRDVHVSNLVGAEIPARPYADLLKKQLEIQETRPIIPGLARHIPADQYALFVGGSAAGARLLDELSDWGGGLLRLATLRARDEEVLAVIERQLCLTVDDIHELTGRGAIGGLALTGSEPPNGPGADVAVVFQLKSGDAFIQLHDGRMAEAAKAPGVERRVFSYRGNSIAACYSADRRISAFRVQKDDVAYLSNSHIGIRRLVDTLVGQRPSLAAAEDFQLTTCLLPPEEAPDRGYFYASDAFLRHLIDPVVRITCARGRQCRENLMILGRAATFFRLENGRAPASLSELAVMKYIDPEKLACPHGGAYAFDGSSDVASCSVHNRLSFLTPGIELETLQVSEPERAAWVRFRDEHAPLWKGTLAPIAARWQANGTVRAEFCLVSPPGATGVASLRECFSGPGGPPLTVVAPKNAFASIHLTPGRARLGEYLRMLPGIAGALADDPTLTDLAWLGDRLSLHLYDAGTILEVDPTQFKPLEVLIPIPVIQQAAVATAVLASSLPASAAIEVDDPEKARRLLDRLAARIVLEDSTWMGMSSGFDVYRLADQDGHARYVLSYRFYALKVRLHVAVVGRLLLAATTAEALRDAIAAGVAAPPAGEEEPLHAAIDVNMARITRFREALRIYWEEKARAACHANVITLDVLARVYGDGRDDAAMRLFGARYFCPEGGTYSLDPAADSVVCSIHGERRNSRQLAVDAASSQFDRLFNRTRAVRARVRFVESALLLDVETEAPPPAGE